jgi:hypothetical protein
MTRATVADPDTLGAERAPWPWRVAAVLAMLAAGALLALVVAHWGWRWFGPAPAVVEVERPAPPSVEAIIAAAPFGRAAETPTATAPTSASALPPDTRLLGVFAGEHGDGYALLRLPDRGAMLVKRGGSIASGVTLDAVRPNAITIRERGASRELALRPESRPGAPLAAPRRTPLAAQGAVRAACAAPPGFNGPVYRLNAELLSGMAAQPQSWAQLLDQSSGALVVRDETGLAAMLGMKAGDRVVQANGIALSNIDDVLSAVVKPLAASQPVRVVGTTREGKMREWLFLNASACPV